MAQATAAAADLDAMDDTSTAEVPAERMPLLEKLFLRRLQKGDPRAFRQLVRLHEDRVFSLVLRMLGDRQEAEDVSQEVFVAVHRHLPKFRGDSKLSTWIYRVAKNHCLNRLKYLAHRQGHDEHGLEHVDASEAGPFVARAERPDAALLGAEERAQVQRALDRLSPEHRLLVVLRDIEGLAYEEISRITELPPGTVKSRIHRARAALAGTLAEAGMVPEGANAADAIGTRTKEGR